jgi:hypothetical protein
MSDLTTLTAKEFAAAAWVFRWADGLMETAEAWEVLCTHDERLRREVTRLREALALIASEHYDPELHGEEAEIAACALAPVPQEDR